MKKVAVALSLLVALFVILVQLEVLAGPFESLNPRAEAGAVSPQVSFSGDLRVGGVVDAQAGIRFPDGTVQLSAAGTATDLTANAGLYNNRIVELSPAPPYVEVCVKNGALDFDVHVNGGDTTAGGDCLPGDIGWVIEREERVAELWEEARLTCLINGMRLPEPFEFMVSCRRAEQLGLLEMTGNFEWASNHASNQPGDPAAGGIGAAILGNQGCDDGIWGWLARVPATSETRAYRCAR